MAVATARASKRLVHFVDEMGIKCWGALAAGVAQPRPGEVVPLAACPVTASCAMGEVGSRRTIKELLPALPVERPAVICIGLNYKAHAAECGMPEPRLPVVFFKNPASVTGDGGPIEVPKCAQDPLEVDYEIELGVVIAKDCKDVSAKDALSYVLGYVAANDVSARAWQVERGGSQWCRGKSFDTFCPVGPVLGLAEAFDPTGLRVWTTVNGEVRQDSNTSDLIFSVRDVVAFLSQGTTLQAGTLILTGTPWGVGMGHKPPKYLHDGDEVSCGVDGIGTVTNTVRFLK